MWNRGHRCWRRKGGGHLLPRGRRRVWRHRRRGTRSCRPINISVPARSNPLLSRYSLFSVNETGPLGTDKVFLGYHRGNPGGELLDESLFRSAEDLASRHDVEERYDNLLLAFFPAIDSQVRLPPPAPAS